MILTVTLNPLLERRLMYNSIILGRENRNGIEVLRAGGKGINVSRQLNQLGIDNLAFTFLGGANGKVLKEVLSKESIKCVSIRTSDKTRNASVIIDGSNNSTTTYFGSNSKINTAEAEEFKQKLEKMIQNCEIVVFAGSSPCSQTDHIISYGIELANKHDKVSICDTYGVHLSECINAAPTIIHNNINEIKNSLGYSLDTQKQEEEYLNYLYSKNIKQAFITNGKNKTYSSNFDYHYVAENPAVEEADPTGSGDSFVAGICYGWHNNLTFEETFLFASKLGALNAKSWDTSNVKLSDVESFDKKIIISSLGKKMKTLDVTPAN